MPGFLRAILILVVSLFAVGCGSQKNRPDIKPDHYLRQHQPEQGVYHRVQRGDTLYGISKTYGVAVDTLISANGISNPDALEVGFQMYIPGASTVRVTEPAVNPANGNDLDSRSPPEVTQGRKGPIVAEKSFIWPVRGKVLVRFGAAADGLDSFAGIKIQSAIGTRVQAAKSGKVTWVSEGMAGYGKVIAIRHSDGYTTLYGYCSEVLVKQGVWVKQGDAVALSGKSGLTQVPSLYFQVSTAQKDLDPLQHLK